jgi:hypothetical protein
MKRIFRFAVLFIAAFLLVPFLPFYIARTMIQSQTTGGDIITWQWNLRTLNSFWSDYNYFRPEEQFIFWLFLNLAPACLYSLIIALAVDRLFAYLSSGK